MRILVSGAAGFIGYEVCKMAIVEGHKVLALDTLGSGLYPSDEKVIRAESLSRFENISFLQGDIRNQKALLKEDFTHIVHCAAMPGLRFSWENPQMQIDHNVTATQAAIELAKQRRTERFIHISTSSVYGKHAIANEDSPLRPASPYGATKLAAEMLVSQQLGLAKIPYAILRLFSVYGPGQRPDMAYRRIMEALVAGRPFTIYGSGLQTRTNTYVEDVASAILKAIGLPSNVSPTMNIGGNQQVSLLEAISTIEQISGSTLETKFSENIDGDQLETKADIRKAKAILDFENRLTLEEGLEQQWRWLLGSQS